MSESSGWWLLNLATLILRNQVPKSAKKATHPFIHPLLTSYPHTEPDLPAGGVCLVFFVSEYYLTASWLIASIVQLVVGNYGVSASC